MYRSLEMAHLLLFLHVLNRNVLSHALRVFQILNQIQAFSIFHLSSVVATGSKVIVSAGTEIAMHCCEMLEMFILCIVCVYKQIPTLYLFLK